MRRGGGAPCDFRSLPADSARLAYWLGGSRAEKPLAYRQASPLGFVTADDPPCFFFHGDADLLVPLLSPRTMVDRLSASRFRQPCTPWKAGHIQAFFDTAAMMAGIDFLDKHLQPAPKTEASNP